jgi:hypothetical protein
MRTFLISMGIVLSSSVCPVQIEAAPQRPVVSVEIDRDVITIGDEVLLTYTIQSDLNARALFPKPHLMPLGDFRLKRAKKFIREVKKENIIWQQALVVTTFEVGERTIPAQKFFVEVEGQREELFSELIVVNVESVLDEETQPSDIRGLKGQRILTSWWTPVLWLILLGLLIMLVLFLLRKRRQRVDSVSLEPLRPAHEVALMELEALQSKGLIEQGKIKEFYIELSNILRRYMDRRYTIESLDRTTEELISEMRSKRVEPDVIRMIRNVLVECDLVKFAKLRPQVSEIDLVHKTAVQFIERTRPLPAPPVEDESVSQTGAEVRP